MGRVVTATEFKAKCLSLLDEMERTGDSITITRRGKPVAVLARPAQKAWKSPGNILAGKIKELEDISQYDTSELWDALRTK